MQIEVRGYFVESGRMMGGPLGQTAARYPFRNGRRQSKAFVSVTAEEAERLTHCTLCGRATVNPSWHLSWGNRLAHCEICDKHRTPDGASVDGWYGGPYPVVE